MNVLNISNWDDMDEEQHKLETSRERNREEIVETEVSKLLLI